MEVFADINGADIRLRRSRRTLRLQVAFVTIGLIAAVVAVYALAGPLPPGDELDLGQNAAYGWYASKDVGSVFTDGLNVVQVMPQARGRLRLISARPLMDGGTMRVIGILARVNPDMLPTGFNAGGFQDSPGFPPSLRDAAGAVPVNGLVVYPPKPGQHRWIELQIGYEVVAPGRAARRGVELIYEYGGVRHKVVIPSCLAVCAPATVTCQPEYDT
jgi:hypothetical protein